MKSHERLVERFLERDEDGANGKREEWCIQGSNTSLGVKESWGDGGLLFVEYYYV